MKNLLYKYRHAWILSYGLLYIPWFLYLEKSVTTEFYNLHIRLDDFIPFNEYFIVPYLLWFFYVAGAILFFFFTNKDDYYRLCIMLFTGMTVCLIIYTIFPNGTDLRPVVDPNENFFTYLVSLVHAADTNTNVFPSIHVYNSIAVHVAISRSKQLQGYKWLQISSFVFMIVVCLSTVFLKQHSAIDGIASIILACILYYPAYHVQSFKKLAFRSRLSD